MVGVCCRPAHQEEEVHEPSSDNWKKLLSGELVLTVPWHLLEAQSDTGHSQSKRFLDLLEDSF